MKTRVVVLGAGFGGLELATMLSEALGDDVDVTLIDKNDAFVFGYSKLDVMFGRKTPDAVRLAYRDIAKPGVRFLQQTITAIDPEVRRVTTDGGAHEADVLVVALGADYDLDATLARPRARRSWATPPWETSWQLFTGRFGASSPVFEARKSIRQGTACSRPSTGRRGQSNARGRSSTPHEPSGSSFAPAFTPVSASSTETKVRGIAVHTGARVASLAGPGEVLVSSTVKDLVAGSGIDFEDRGARTSSRASLENGDSMPLVEIRPRHPRTRRRRRLCIGPAFPIARSLFS